MDGCFILERIEVDYIGCNNRGNTYVYVKQREEEECDANIADDACHGRGVGWGGGGVLWFSGPAVVRRTPISRLTRPAEPLYCCVHAAGRQVHGLIMLLAAPNSLQQAAPTTCVHSSIHHHSPDNNKSTCRVFMLIHPCCALGTTLDINSPYFLLGVELNEMEYVTGLLYFTLD